MGIEVSADLELKLGKVSEQLDQVSNLLEDTPRSGNPVRSPLLRRLTASKVMNGTYSFCDCGVVPTGYLWDLRRLVVRGGPSPFAPVVGSVFPFIANTVPQDTNTLPPGFFGHEIDIVTTTIPSNDLWAGGQVTLLGGEHLVLCLKVPDSQSIVVYFQVWEFLESDIGFLVGR
jgi:hypothetical protein